MPRIELIPEVLYQPNDPYHWEIDNIPLKNILRRQNLINLSLDDVLEQIRDAIGTQGSISNRLNQSINADGSLKNTAIDAIEHSIEAHTDTANYVRMTKSQSDKLNLVADEAKNIELHVYDNSQFVVFDEGPIEFIPSTSIKPVVEEPNQIKFEINFPEEAAHRHFYGLAPVPSNLAFPNYIDYKVNSSSTPFIANSLRIYVNGVRIFKTGDIYVPGPMVEDPWTLLSYSENPSQGTFELSTAISEDDLIYIDFDILLL